MYIIICLISQSLWGTIWLHPLSINMYKGVHLHYDLWMQKSSVHSACVQSNGCSLEKDSPVTLYCPAIKRYTPLWCMQSYLTDCSLWRHTHNRHHNINRHINAYKDVVNVTALVILGPSFHQVTNTAGWTEAVWWGFAQHLHRSINFSGNLGNWFMPMEN